MKTLLREIHRRSLWQVLGVYLAGSWVALQVVEQLTTAAGLPDWVQPFALVLLIVGLPIVMGTAFVQVGIGGARERVSGADSESALPSGRPPRAGGRPSDEPAAVPGSDGRATTRPRGTLGRILTWRNAVIGGAGAAVVLGGFVAAYFVMRATGVGPAASLVAKGVIERGEPILLAEFENSSNDPSLGGVVTEALRVDLSNGHAVSVVDGGTVRRALQRMGRAPDEPFTAELAHEVAVRDGIKAVISGEVGSAGSGYMLVASISAADGAPLATFRRTAKSSDEIIPAIDALSQDIREKTGESLRSIRAEEPLESVTTSSLDALRRYSESIEAEDLGEHVEAKRLLEEALELDPEFAMAWRKLAVAVSDAGGTREEAMNAATRAYELRDRLTEHERYLAIAYYHNQVTGDADEQIRAYRNVLASYPDDPTALNNLSIALSDRLQYEESIELLERAVSGPGTSGSAFSNLAFYRAAVGDIEGARAAIELMGRRDVWYHAVRFWVAMSAGEWEGVDEIGAELVALPDAPEDWRTLGRTMPAVAYASRGRMREARDHFEEALRAALALGRLSDALSVRIDLANAERLADSASGRAGTVLRDLLSGADLEGIPVRERDYGALALALVRTGLLDEAGEIVRDWEAAGAFPSGIQGWSFDEVAPLVDALTTAATDPTAGAAALRVLRGRRDCERCFAIDLSRALEASGETTSAIDELETAVAIDTEGGLWWGLRRAMAHERLGRLYDEVGAPEMAAEHHALFVDAWQEADPELQPRVEAARARIAASEGTGE